MLLHFGIFYQWMKKSTSKYFFLVNEKKVNGVAKFNFGIE